METAATPVRDLRTFLLVAPFDAGEIGARIKQARLEAGLSQEDLSALATFAQRSLQNYETGRTIPFKHLREIGELLNRETSWFLYGDPEAPDVSVDARLADLEAKVDEMIRLTSEALSLLHGAQRRGDGGHREDLAS